jgi:cyclopropane fatty-acyl-phospholipid synthase-like methyltransferase
LDYCKWQENLRAGAIMSKNKSYIDNQNKWLKKYIDAELKSVREAVGKVEATNKEAVDKVERTNADYRATQNEWRGQIKDAAVQYITRREVWAVVLLLITIIMAIYFKK